MSPKSPGGSIAMHEKIDRAVQKIKSIGGDKVRLITLYGSASAGRMKEDSDIDICVYYEDASQFRLKVLSDLFDDVYDIKIFQQLPLPLRMQVLRARSCTQMTGLSSTTKPMRPQKSLNPSSADTTIIWEYNPSLEECGMQWHEKLCSEQSALGPGAAASGLACPHPRTRVHPAPDGIS